MCSSKVHNFKENCNRKKRHNNLVVTKQAAIFDNENLNSRKLISHNLSLVNVMQLKFNTDRKKN